MGTMMFYKFFNIKTADALFLIGKKQQPGTGDVSF